MPTPDTFEFRLQPWEFDEAETCATESTAIRATAMWQGKQQRFWLRQVKEKWMFIRAEGQDENWNWASDLENEFSIDGSESSEWWDRFLQMTLEDDQFGRLVVWPQGEHEVTRGWGKYKINLTFGASQCGVSFSYDQCGTYHAFELEEDKNFSIEDFHTQPASYWRDLATSLFADPKSDLNFVVRYTKQLPEENVWDFMQLAHGSREEMEQVLRWMLIVENQRRNTPKDASDNAATTTIWCVAKGCLDRDEVPNGEWCDADLPEADAFDTGYSVADGRSLRWQRLGELWIRYYQPTVKDACFFYAEQRFYASAYEESDKWTPYFLLSISRNEPTSHERLEALFQLKAWLVGKALESEITWLLDGAAAS